jgi:hypothetical protein
LNFIVSGRFTADESDVVDDDEEDRDDGRVYADDVSLNDNELDDIRDSVKLDTDVGGVAKSRLMKTGLSTFDANEFIGTRCGSDNDDIVESL